MNKPNLKTIKAIVRLMEEHDIAKLNFQDGGFTIEMHPQQITKHAAPKQLSSKDILDRHEQKEAQRKSLDEIIENDPGYSEWQMSGVFNRGN